MISAAPADAEEIKFHDFILDDDEEFGSAADDLDVLQEFQGLGDD